MIFGSGKDKLSKEEREEKYQRVLKLIEDFKKIPIFPGTLNEYENVYGPSEIINYAHIDSLGRTINAIDYRELMWFDPSEAQIRNEISRKSSGNDERLVNTINHLQSLFNEGIEGLLTSIALNHEPVKGGNQFEYINYICLPVRKKRTQ